MFKKSRIKIVASIMFILVLLHIGTLGVIYITSYMDVYQKNQGMLERYAEEYIPGGIPGVEKPPPGKMPPEPSNTDNRFNLSTFYSVAIDNSGDVIRVDKGENTLYSDEYLTEIAEEFVDGGKHRGTSGNFVYLIEENESYTLVALMDNTLVSDSITTLFRYTMIFGGCVIVILFFLSQYLARRIVRPLEESYQKQKQFISDAGHELKTPISVVNANGEMLLREIGENKWLSNIQYENSRMAALVNQLLELARTEKVSANMCKVDLSRLVMGGTLPFESIAFDRGLKLSYSVEEGIAVNGNSDQLGQLVSILLDNALEHSMDGGTITISLKKERNSAVLSVLNQGEAIPEEERSEIFERFYRGDMSRTGGSNHYGLGLAIAKAIVITHRGKISVSCDNNITEFSVVIPFGHVN